MLRKYWHDPLWSWIAWSFQLGKKAYFKGLVENGWAEIEKPVMHVAVRRVRFTQKGLTAIWASHAFTKGYVPKEPEPVPDEGVKR